MNNVITPKLDKTIFTLNQKVKHTLEDFPYIQAVAYGYLGNKAPKMDKKYFRVRKHSEFNKQAQP